jgi:hypothetical protein
MFHLEGCDEFILREAEKRFFTLPLVPKLELGNETCTPKKTIFANPTCVDIRPPVPQAVVPLVWAGVYAQRIRAIFCQLATQVKHQACD